MLNSLDIPKITGGKILQSGEASEIHRLLLDSRKIVQPAHSLFIAVTGERHDGHAFISELYHQGVRNFLVEKEIDFSRLQNATITLVEDAVIGLQQIAARHRMSFNMPVIGITGSNGKTVVKEWLNQMLCEDYTIVRSPRSYNSQVGVPLSVWNMDTHHSLGIFEAGISLKGEMELLEKVIQPTLGILTNIREAHLENFSSKHELANEKLKLFVRSEKLVCCIDQPEVLKAIKGIGFEHSKLYSWCHASSFTGVAEVLFNQHSFVISEEKNTPHGTEIRARWKDQEVNFSFAFSDQASIENCITCIVTLLALGAHPEQVQSRLERLSPLSMRMELLDGVNQCLLINDAYSSDIHSLEIALDFMHANSQHRSKTVILSDILQAGIPENLLYSRINDLLVQKNVQHIIGIGPGISNAASSFSMKKEFYPETELFLKNKSLDDFSGMIILLKGARDFRLERITSWLQQNTHDTVLEVDLGALAHNLNYFKSKLKSDTRLMVMVKAFGYGSGAHEVASLLEFNKVDYLAVAYTDEGVLLRRAGISLPIMVMNPEEGSLPSLIRHKLEPEIYSFHSLHRFVHALEIAGVSGPYPVHLKIDTGMHRLGFEPGDMDQLCNQLLSLPQLKLASVFTHLVASENEVHDSFTVTQLNLFNECSILIQQSTGFSFLRHALNTGGIQRFPSHQLDMVRLGIGLYGIAPHESDQQELKNVTTLRTVISQIKLIKTGESVGYGRSFVAKEETKIATIPLGYADGLRRSMGNGNGYVMIGGKPAYIVGNVCMDMTMVNISSIPCKEGDPVIVFGSGLPLTEIGRLSGTIAYEILTSVPQRVRRVYIQE